MGAAQYEKDRRWFPRIAVERELTLIDEGHAQTTTAMDNISPGGLRVMCDRATAHALHPSGRYIKAGTGPRFYARFSLPAGEGDLPMEVGCRMVYLELRGDDRVAIGLEFERFIGESQDNLERFIAQALEPAPAP